MADIDGFDEKTGSFYVAAELAASSAEHPASLAVYIPQAARMVSLDVSLDGEGAFSIYVTNSNYDEAEAEGETVTWYPTVHMHVTESIFTTKSGCAGAYKVVMESGSAMVKARAK